MIRTFQKRHHIDDFVGYESYELNHMNLMDEKGLKWAKMRKNRPKKYPIFAILMNYGLGAY